MNASVGLKRIAQLVRWITSGIAVVIFGGGLAIALFSGRDSKLLVVTMCAGIAFVVYGAGKGLGWVIDGFAEPKESK